MELFTKENGLKKVSGLVKALKSGKTEASTWATGRMIKPTVREDSSTLTVMSTRENGKMIRLMEEEPTNMLTAQSMLVTGKKTDNTDMA